MEGPALERRLAELRDLIDVPREDDGTAATLVALMPCEPAIGAVAVAAWADSDGGELVELVRLADGARVDDPAALREALALLAMVETVEELASFDALDELNAGLRGFAAEHGPLLDGFDASFSHAHASALGALDRLRALAPVDEVPRMARTQLLDELGAALRELEQRWERLEQAAEAWSDAHLAATGRDEAAVELVQSLWRTLSIARRGPLAQPVSAALHQGREAGIAMAAAIAAGRGG